MHVPGPLAERPVDGRLVGVLVQVDFLVGVPALVVARHVSGDRDQGDRFERGGATPVTAFIMPGPTCSSRTPGLPVARAYPSAACAAVCSCRAMTNLMLVRLRHRGRRCWCGRRSRRCTPLRRTLAGRPALRRRRRSRARLSEDGHPAQQERLYHGVVVDHPAWRFTPESGALDAAEGHMVEPEVG